MVILACAVGVLLLLWLGFINHAVAPPSKLRIRGQSATVAVEVAVAIALGVASAADSRTWRSSSGSHAH